MSTSTPSRSVRDCASRTRSAIGRSQRASTSIGVSPFDSARRSHALSKATAERPRARCGRGRAPHRRTIDAPQAAAHVGAQRGPRSIDGVLEPAVLEGMRRAVLVADDPAPGQEILRWVRERVALGRKPGDEAAPGGRLDGGRGFRARREHRGDLFVRPLRLRAGCRGATSSAGAQELEGQGAEQERQNKGKQPPSPHAAILAAGSPSRHTGSRAARPPSRTDWLPCGSITA